MSKVIEQAVNALNEKLTQKDFNGCVKMDVIGEGAIIVDQNGARAEDGSADVTMQATAEVFEDIFNDTLSPTTAYMTGKLKIEGDLGQAMAFGKIIA